MPVRARSALQGPLRKSQPAISSQGIPLEVFGQEGPPALSIEMAILLIEPSHEILAFQRIECRVDYFNNGGLPTLRESRQSFGVRSPYSDGGGICRGHFLIVDEM